MTTSTTTLKDRLQGAMKTALKAGEKKQLGVIRLMLAAIKQQEIDGRVALDDTGVIGVLDKMVKQRKDSATQYRDAGRIDLAEIEEYEISVIREYLPQPLGSEEIARLIQAAVAESGAVSVRDMAKVMALLKPKMQGRADMGLVSQEVKKTLSTA